MKRFLLAGLFLVSAFVLGAETVTKAPTQYFTDYAGVVDTSVASRLNSTLAELEKTDSTQFYVVIYPKFEGEVLEDFTQKAAQAWGIGQKGKNNGLILFLFADDGTGHKLIRYEIGYGLEGVFTDAASKTIIEKSIVPALKVNNWSAAVESGVSEAIKYVKGEYKAEDVKSGVQLKLWHLLVIIGIWLLFLCIWPSATLSFTGDILNLVLILATAGKGGSSGGGGSFGGGGSSGRS